MINAVNSQETVALYRFHHFIMTLTKHQKIILSQNIGSVSKQLSKVRRELAWKLLAMNFLKRHKTVYVCNVSE
jgi:hypothetical protein